jgi:hypothetical protein
MATQKQIKANRKNAKKSTGPKTEEGKAAVSQNAVKHGLFAESVVTGEKEAEYEAFYGELLAELAPRGAIELLLAERIVSLWWRLRRAERMQNQAIEDMIVLFVTNNTSRRCREYHIRDHGLRPDDPGYDLDDLPLGRIGTRDFANSRILERMLLYERRIENSLNRAMKELKRFQTIRRIEWQNAAQRKNKSIYRDPFLAEAATRFSSAEKYGDLKKQSQFMPDLMGLTPFMNGSYGEKPVSGDFENKANRTQSQSATGPTLGVEEREKSVTTSTG